MQFLHPMAAPNCLRVPSVEQGALFVVQGLGRFSSAQGCFKVPVKMPCELERCGGGMFVLLMLILVLLTPSCGGVSSHGVTVCWSVSGRRADGGRVKPRVLVESHRMAGVGRDLCGSSGPASCQRS